jgi:ABC-2 type transport system permease protein
MNLVRTRAVFLKELRHIVRDSRSLYLALGVPVLLLALFGYALSLDVDRIPTLVYDADRSSESRELISRFAASRYFDIRGYVSEYGTIEREMDAGRILMGLAIPRDYSERIGGGREAEVQILLDGSDSNTASIAKGYAEAVVRIRDTELKAAVQNRRSGMKLISPVVAQSRIWYNESLKSKNYIVPGLIAVILMIIAALLTSLTIAREWEMGTMEQLLSTPLRPSELVLGKMLAFFLIGITDTAITVVVGVFVFDVPFRGSIADEEPNHGVPGRNPEFISAFVPAVGFHLRH